MGNVPEVIGEYLPNLHDSHPRYWSAFVAACHEADPPFGLGWYGELFRKYAQDLSWLSNLLVLNAQKEADGSRQLWAFASRIEDEHCREKVRLHAIDESRHADFYISILGLIFPESYSAAELRRYHDISPGFKTSDQVQFSAPSSRQAVMDEIIQMNIGEVRTLINQLLMRPVLSVLCPDKNRERYEKLANSLCADEGHHIAYTADLIEAHNDDGFVKSMFARRLADFSNITLQEVGVIGIDTVPTFD
jgi:hypothetical protein